jgi:hypothetical protein
MCQLNTLVVRACPRLRLRLIEDDPLARADLWRERR